MIDRDDDAGPRGEYGLEASITSAFALDAPKRDVGNQSDISGVFEHPDPTNERWAAWVQASLDAAADRIAEMQREMQARGIRDAQGFLIPNEPLAEIEQAKAAKSAGFTTVLLFVGTDDIRVNIDRIKESVS